MEARSRCLKTLIRRMYSLVLSEWPLFGLMLEFAGLE